jgi:hypothetical protein
MIPAIPSCIFAFYLHQTLNKPVNNDAANNSAANNSAANNDAANNSAANNDAAIAMDGAPTDESLSARLAELQSRLDALTDSQDGAENELTGN